MPDGNYAISRQKGCTAEETHATRTFLGASHKSETERDVKTRCVTYPRYDRLRGGNTIVATRISCIARISVIDNEQELMYKCQKNPRDKCR
jgi:hypothetical protein